MQSIAWANGKVRLLDQTRLPQELVFLEIDDYRQMIEAIQALRIRGAPALGVAAAYGILLGALGIATDDPAQFLAELEQVTLEIVASRPTAANIAWAAGRMREAALGQGQVSQMKETLLREAARILAEDVETNKRLGGHGAALIPDNATVLTHCNTGSLATAGYGTALGVIRAARDQGKRLHIIATETRPLLQGARLTAWELVQDGIPATLITDSMAGYFLHSGKTDCVIVGADRIAMNGDVANKIGTYAIAVIARENGIPFYVAAPTSTIDRALATGDGIPIEERRPEEVTGFGGVQTAPEGIGIANPAFDVTPHRYISAIVTEVGVARDPYDISLPRMLQQG